MISVADFPVPLTGDPALGDSPFDAMEISYVPAAVPPVISVLKFIATASSLHTVFGVGVPTGCANTVIVNVLAGPVHKFLVPVTLIVATIDAPVVFTTAVNVEILPVPEAAKLIKGLSFVQSKVTPPDTTLDPNVIAGTVPPEQTTIFVTALTIGVGLMVMVNVFALAPALTQPFLVAITVMVPTMSAPVLLAGAMYDMSPLPDVANPMLALVFVQLITEPATLLNNGMLIDSPVQNDWLETAVTTGSGLMVMLNVWAGPTQPFFVAVTLKFPTIGAPLVFTGAV